MPHDLVVTMRARLAQQAARARNLSMEQLPQWAQKSILDTNIPVVDNKTSRTVEAPKGRWAMRANLEPNHELPMHEKTSLKEKRLDPDGSKEDSSIDSGTELRTFKPEEDKRRTFVICKGDLKDIMKCDDRSDTLHQRSRHHTDDSSLGSFKYEDQESTEHDGDVEDMSEGESLEGPRNQLIYYPPPEDTNSDFTVNTMDEAELRKSQRQAKRRDLLLAHGETSQSVSGSQESDDDEQASTHSRELSDRKITGSIESLNMLSRREKVLKNTFESLSGAEMEKEPVHKSKTTLSSKYMSSSNVRNNKVIQAAKHTKQESQASSKREELQRRIEETRRQLQCVGYRSKLQSSQSIQDLSPRGINYHERKATTKKISFQIPNIARPEKWLT